MTAFVTAPAGFLLAVLWFDLMFDVQALGHRGRELPEPVLDSISAYYRRVTTGARPMSWLVAAVMLATLTAIAVQLVNCDAPRWVNWTSLALAAGAIGLAAAHTFPAAARLGAGAGDRQARSRLARAILRDHLACLTAISALLAIQLAAT
jgi:hypothetical protein